MTRTTLLCLCALAASLLGATCNPQPPPDPGPAPGPAPVPPAPPPDPPAPDPEPPPPPPVKATCETACAHQDELDCDVAKPTPEGHSCVEVCENVETGPILSVRWNLECLSLATACDGCPVQ